MWHEKENCALIRNIRCSWIRILCYCAKSTTSNDDELPHFNGMMALVVVTMVIIVVVMTTVDDDTRLKSMNWGSPFSPSGRGLWIKKLSGFPLKVGETGRSVVDLWGCYVSHSWSTRTHTEIIYIDANMRGEAVMHYYRREVFKVAWI